MQQTGNNNLSNIVVIGEYVYFISEWLPQKQTKVTNGAIKVNTIIQQLY